jgi:chromosome segregation ATPase
MKENNINVYDEKNNNEKSEDVRLTNNLTNNEKEKRTEEYDKFKNRMASLFKEFEHDKNSIEKLEKEIKDGEEKIIILTKKEKKLRDEINCYYKKKRQMNDTIKLIENNAVKAAIEIIKKQNNLKNSFETNKYDSDIYSMESTIEPNKQTKNGKEEFIKLFMENINNFLNKYQVYVNNLYGIESDMNNNNTII